MMIYDHSLRKPKAVLFDMGDTLIQEVPPDFLEGCRAVLAHATNLQEVSAEEVLAFSQDLLQNLLKVREEALIEFSCVNYQRLLHDCFGLKFDIGPDEIESVFRSKAFPSVRTDGIREALGFLDSVGIRRAVLSNSIFCSATLENDLRRLGLLDGFEFVMASADYCVRKPHSALFRAAAGRLNLASDEVWYAGDNWVCDVVGASGAGMKTIWYNPSRRPIPDGIKPSIDIHAWDELPGIKSMA